MEEDTSELVRIWREKKMGVTVEVRTTDDKAHNFVKQECSVPEMMNLTNIHPDSLPPNAHQHLEQRPVEQQRFSQHSIFGGISGSDPLWMPPEDPPPPPEKKASKSSFLDPANWNRTTLNDDEAIIKFNKRASNARFTNGRFKCHECFSNFAREEKLNKHIMINHHESAGPHMCRFCKRRFQKPCKLRMHVKKHYVQIECLRCNMQFDGEGLAFQHEEFHRGVTTTCKYCNHQFRHKSTYYQHLRTQHRSSHICTLCGASFVSKAGLNVHKKRLHSDKTMPKEPDANIYCRRCDIKFASMQAYQEHYRHSALHADGVDVYVSDDVRGANYVRCTVCHEQFFTYQACLKHHRRMHPDTPFMKKSVASPTAASSERVNCDICGVLIKATSLYTHMNAHTRTKVYTCQICGMQFPYPTSLLRHKVTHTGEKKYPCPLCEKRFTQRNSMQLHYRTFHLKEPYPKRNRRKKTAEAEVAPPPPPPPVQHAPHPHHPHVSLMGL